jgi:NTP pyrophosphatase (non-canonical NTP hydrolase)
VSLNELARAINDTARTKGFWEAERNFGEMLMLATSELSEALEEHRAGRPNHYYEVSPVPQSLLIEVGDAKRAEAIWIEHLNAAEAGPRKPEGVAVELADCIIRCLDTMHSLGVDIDAIVAEKMAYNATRPPKHGKAY